MTRAPYVMPKPEAEFASSPQPYNTTLGARMYNPVLANSLPADLHGRNAISGCSP